MIWVESWGVDRSLGDGGVARESGVGLWDQERG